MGLSNLKSNIAELAVATECSKKHWVVCFPHGENTPYDLLVDTNTEILKVQVKYISIDNNTIPIRFTSSTGVKYKDTVDVIAVYCPDNNNVYWIKLKDQIIDNNKTGINLRMTPTKNNQNVGVKLAEDYLLRV